MDESKFLIVGANGQLGTALRERYPQAQAVDSGALDIADSDAVAGYDWSNVAVILNAAAYTNVDGAETPEGRVTAWKVNATGVANLVNIAHPRSITLVHMSTDYVFDGRQSVHNEAEPVSPLGAYASTKAAGDIVALMHDKTYILRTGWVIGEGKNFVRTMMGLAKKDISPSVVDDQIGRLTFTDTLVEAIDHLLKTEAKYGVYNISNDGEEATWADITRAIFKELGRDDLTVTNITTEEYFKNNPKAAPRPLQSTLNLDLIKATGLELRDWREDLHKYIQNEVNQEVNK